MANNHEKKAQHLESLGKSKLETPLHSHQNGYKTDNNKRWQEREAGTLLYTTVRNVKCTGTLENRLAVS